MDSPSSAPRLGESPPLSSATTPKDHRRFQVRADAPQCAGGHIGHMTADELLARCPGISDLSCPCCGCIHLNREEIDHLEQKLIIHSARYRTLCLQAEEASPSA